MHDSAAERQQNSSRMQFSWYFCGMILLVTCSNNCWIPVLKPSLPGANPNLLIWVTEHWLEGRQYCLSIIMNHYNPYKSMLCPNQVPTFLIHLCPQVGPLWYKMAIVVYTAIGSYKLFWLSLFPVRLPRVGRSVLPLFFNFCNALLSY